MSPYKITRARHFHLQFPLDSTADQSRTDRARNPRPRILGDGVAFYSDGCGNLAALRDSLRGAIISVRASMGGKTRSETEPATAENAKPAKCGNERSGKSPPY